MVMDEGDTPAVDLVEGAYCGLLAPLWQGHPRVALLARRREVAVAQLLRDHRRGRPSLARHHVRLRLRRAACTMSPSIGGNALLATCSRRLREIGNPDELSALLGDCGESGASSLMASGQNMLGCRY